MPDPERLVTVARLQLPGEAHIVKNFLEAEGIRVYLSGENASNMMFGYAGAFVAGISLQVAESDASRSLALLEAKEPTPSGEPAAPQSPGTRPGRCPSCGREMHVNEEGCPACEAGNFQAEGEEPEIGDSELASEMAADRDEDHPIRDISRRATIAAIGSILFAPLVFYSLWLLLRHRLLDQQTAKGTLIGFATLALDLLVLGFWTIVFTR